MTTAEGLDSLDRLCSRPPTGETRCGRPFTHILPIPREPV
jgi:hypothetical protein